MFRYRFLCMIISYVRHHACSLNLAPAYGNISCKLVCFVKVCGLVKNGSSLGFDIHSRQCYDFRVLSKRGNCRHPIFDRPQDLDVIVWTLDDHPCLCSFWVPGGLSRAPCLKISQLVCFVLGCEPNTCVFAFDGRGRLVCHALNPPAKSLGRSALYLVDRPLCWSIDHFCWPNPVHLLYADILCQLAQLASTLHPLHTRVWRDLPFCLASLRSFAFGSL